MKQTTEEKSEIDVILDNYEALEALLKSNAAQQFPDNSARQSYAVSVGWFNLAFEDGFLDDCLAKIGAR